jgi:hypothetical protein
MQARNGKEVMGVMDRYFARRKLRAVARYERCEISAFWQREVNRNTKPHTEPGRIEVTGYRTLVKEWKPAYSRVR